jgi:hypothetical protein
MGSVRQKRTALKSRCQFVCDPIPSCSQLLNPCTCGLICYFLCTCDLILQFLKWISNTVNSIQHLNTHKLKMAAPQNFHNGWKHEMVPNVGNSWKKKKKKNLMAPSSRCVMTHHINTHGLHSMCHMQQLALPLIDYIVAWQESNIMCSCVLLKMVTLCYSEAVLPTYKMTRCHNSDNSVTFSYLNSNCDWKGTYEMPCRVYHAGRYQLNLRNLSWDLTLT